ncbi:MAG TPA: DUF4157 domain-containing protein [Kofleriaceae bacterium]|nr:DUF4157 domain-containing protein [Kofleriaceae bacterium]
MKVHNFDRKRELDLELDPELDPELAPKSRPHPGKRATADGIPPRPVQRKASGRAASGEVRGASGPGMPLPDEVRRRMERAFGADFSGVRIHTGDEAATAVGAKAFTQGTDIHFAPGEYDPGSTLGLELLGHELAHVVQQAQGRVNPTGERGGMPAADDSWLEHEADELGARAARGEPGVVEVAYGMTAMPHALEAPVQRQKAPQPAPAAADEDRNQRLADVQGHWMLHLLPEVEAIRGGRPFTAEEYDHARAHFGPRLVAAMRTVEARLGGQKWVAFIAANHGDVQSLPDDQVGEIMGYLGVPKDQLPVRVTNGKHGMSYDAIVDMGKKEIWILYRAKVQVAEQYEGKFGKPPAQVVAEFSPRFKSSIEAAWSGHPVKLDKPLGGINGFTTKVSVAVVESGHHLVWHIVPDDVPELGSNVNRDRGQIREHADEEVHHDNETVLDPSGKSSKTIQTRQVPSAHEFGHAIGLLHPRPNMKGEGRDYGQTEEERKSIMGTGMNMGVIKDSRGQVLVDPLQPFKLAAEEWGKIWFPGGVSRLNRWQDPK